MKTILSILILIPQMTWAAGYADKLDSLDVSRDQTLNMETRERLYAVQTRAVNLNERWEIKLSAGQVFSGNDFLETQQYGGGVQYHFNDSWSLGGTYSKVSNEFSDPANRVLKTTGQLPDVDFAKSRFEAFVDYNLFYGKMRITKNTIFYFDNYFGLGVAQHSLASGSEIGPLAHAGFVFWFNSMSARLGVTDYYYKETALLSSGSYHNIQGQIEIGYVF